VPFVRACELICRNEQSIQNCTVRIETTLQSSVSITVKRLFVNERGIWRCNGMVIDT
jgi:hypothetical protein